MLETAPIGRCVALDKERAGDQVVQHQNGQKVLLVDSKLASTLAGVTFDYMTTPDKEGFFMRKPSDS